MFTVVAVVDAVVFCSLQRIYYYKSGFAAGPPVVRTASVIVVATVVVAFTQKEGHPRTPKMLTRSGERLSSARRTA